MHRYLKLLTCCFTLVSSPVISDSPDYLSGSEDTELRDAINIWLENDDENSLSKLANLARNRNIAARLLLSRIERTERAPSTYREKLTHEEHKTLFRNPNKRGLFSLSWMLSESESGNALAQLFLSSYKPVVNLDTIRELQSYGEIEATDHPVKIAALYGSDKQKNIILDQLGAPQMRPFVRSQQRPAKRLADGLAALDYIMHFSNAKRIPDSETQSFETTTAQFLALGTPYGDISKDNPWRPFIIKWLKRSLETTPLLNACKLVCGDDIQQCAITLLGLTGGYYEVIRLDSPLENLISQATFLNSPRAASQAMRRAALIRAEHGGEIATISDIAKSSQCLAKQVEFERTSTMYQSSTQ